MIVTRTIDDAVGRFHRPVVAVGNFDGVHRGHQAIIEKACNRSVALGVSSLAVTFEPHPQVILGRQKGNFLLTSLDEKIKLLGDTPLDGVLVLPFDRQFAATGPEDFVQSVYVDQLGISELVVGFSHAFGRYGRGNAELLETSGLSGDFEVHVMPPFRVGDHVVGSSLIRQLISSGDAVLARELFGHSYLIMGRVVRGEGRGRTIDVPTANIGLAEEKQLLPGRGVYAVNVEVNQVTHMGVMNVGVRPTFGSDKEQCEIHILGFNEDIYDATISVFVEQKLRNERKFDGVDALKEQIRLDIVEARSILS